MLDPLAALRQLLRVMPSSATARLVAHTVNQLLRGQPLQQQLGDLAGKRIALCVDDIPLTHTFEIRAGALRYSTQTAHVTIRGSLQDFVALARHQEDPDTLFFQRRLAVEGETETGLHLKNLLDGWDFDLPAHLYAVLPRPIASFTLHGLSRLRPANSHRSNRPAARATGTRQLRR